MSFFDTMMHASSTNSQKISGVMVAVVTDNQDPEKLGRVKLKFPLRESQEETDWARVATLMAGKERGSLFVPEVGDEVLVAFHLGEWRQPYVIGALWSQEAMPPPGFDDKNNIRKFTSRSGHELIFDDKEGSEKIEIHTKKGHTIILDDKSGAITVSEITGTSTVELTDTTITVNCSSNSVKLTSQGDVTITGSKSVKVSAAQISVEASATLDLKGSGALNIKSDGIVAIKGSLVKIN